MSKLRGAGQRLLLGMTMLATACSNGSEDQAERPTTTTTKRPPTTTTTTTKEQWCQSIASMTGELATVAGRVGIGNVPVVPVPGQNIATTASDVMNRAIYLTFFRTYKSYYTEHGSVYARVFVMREGVRRPEPSLEHHDVKQLVEMRKLESDPHVAFFVPAGSKLILAPSVGFMALERGSDPLGPVTPIPGTTFFRDDNGVYRYATPGVPSPMSPYIEGKTLQEAQAAITDAFDRGELVFEGAATPVQWNDGTSARVARDCEPHVVALENPANRLVAP